MSKKQHDRQVARARAKRRADAAASKQRRTRIIAVVLIAALGLSLFAVALLSREGGVTVEEGGDGSAADGGAGDATTPPDEGGGEATTPADDGNADLAGEDGAPSYAAPQGADAEPCPTDDTAPEVSATPRDAAPEMGIDPAAAYVATIETTCGTIVIELATDAAPTTVNNFVALARDDYYVGVPFHRVIDGFMVQGGDPTGTGHGGQGEYPGYTFADELALAEELVGEHGGYPRGTLAMANAGPDTNGSQFFIVQGDPGVGLPPDYTAFGRVTSGMDVVDRIAQGPVEGDRAIDPVRIIDITIEEQPA